ncbi:Alpha/Beta hydrolase protein [Diplogelasinospora grovesii]|uniref:Alpha/Beta hydrolase protein n=1 Tax=Diplogelasinospora grovesii TaxID=303347 RepID=A0AAN6NED7_9PEZI|nr:Alpha/Beta hydrolase protein [Diplogelasinospora grovesii]
MSTLIQYDPEWYALAKPMLAATRERLPLHDVKGRRAQIDVFLAAAGPFTLPDALDHIVHHAQAQDNHLIAIHHFRKKAVSHSESAPGPAIVHIHGGGYTCLSAADSAPSLAAWVQTTGVPMLSIDYRLAPEHPYPVPLEDCWAALNAGGALAASLALLARDRNLSPPLAKQILVYPMIDDRTETDQTGGLASFGIVDVITGWAAYLGDLYKNTEKEVPPYAAAARLEDAKGLPPLYLDCGQLDLFIHENVAFVNKFVAANNIPVECHIYPGVPHAFELFAPTSKAAQKALANRLEAIMSV